MAPPSPANHFEKRFLAAPTAAPTRSSLSTDGGFVEAWAQGYHAGSLVILILIVFCNYRCGIILHKLILLELFLALWHGTFIFFSDPDYGWYLSSTAALLFISYQLHNVVSWLKIRPFLPKWGSLTFIISLIIVQPFWVAEAWSNFEYFNGLGSEVNVRMRPFEALLRDPWWIFTTWKLVDAIKKTYGYKLCSLIRINPRFGVMLACMFISIAFLLTDVAVNAAHVTSSSGINPYWRLALVFKCASDTIFLDDFKSVLDDIVARKFNSANDDTVRCSPTAPGSGSHGRPHSSVHGDSEITGIEPSTRLMIHGLAPEYRTTWESANPFCRRARSAPSVPRTHKYKPNTMSQMHEPTFEWESEQGILMSPETAVHRQKGPLLGMRPTSTISLGGQGVSRGFRP